MKWVSVPILFLISCFTLKGQNHHERFEHIDIQHYIFEVHLNDTTNCIKGRTTIELKLLKPSDKIVLDLVGKGENNGMKVTSVKSDNRHFNFIHKNNQLLVNFDKTINSGGNIQLEIVYSGVPADGLIISENKYGDRTFFGDNWPDRARHWLPTVDHPSDKATLEFLVYAPENYEVISNGYLSEEKIISDDFKRTHWKEDVPLPTKLMVIGVADFAIGNKEKYNNIPVSSWVFPQNKEKGLWNYKHGTKALKYFTEIIGPYSYEKLAHVQSKTRYGGMENASCIFYFEGTGYMDRNFEGLFAHEVAHQWFGNSVTEQNWHHIWLSEGFATYLTHVYNQHFNGEEKFREGLKNDRERVIRYAKKELKPVIDTTVTEYIRLLNANSYQKASWFLYMLCEDLGDEIFFKGLSKYYTDFQNSTALTKDFQHVMETIAGKDLEQFFIQWLWQAGHPILDLSWEQSRDQLHISIDQTQPEYLFRFPLELEIFYMDGTSEFITLKIKQKPNKQRFRRRTKSKIKKLNLDPNVKLLFENANMKY